ncbi:hypothetical protein [Sphingobium cyanobacteriorum]|uniref:hypothetical protein n=1 Tax=Sphingobium cyanobacteriorum TaxID=3063954 RepID=UPI003CC5C77C
MESISVRNFPVDKTRATPLTGEDDAHLNHTIAMTEWLAALPQLAAIFSFENSEISFVHGNDRFVAAFRSPAPRNPLTARVANEWRERIKAFILSGRDSESFELRRDGKLGPEYFMCTIGRLPAVDGRQEHYLFTAIDRTSERTIEKNLRRELLSDGLTALPNRTGFGEEIDDRLANSGWPSNAQFGIIAIDLSRFSRV